MDSILERIHNLSDYTNEKLVRQCGTTTKLAQLITLNGVNDTPNLPM